MSRSLRLAAVAGALALGALAFLVLQPGGSPAGATGGVIAAPDAAGNVGLYTSLELDAAGNPVVSYVDLPSTLKVLHCGNPTCTVGNTIASHATSNQIGGETTSMALNAAGNPVIAYTVDPEGLRILHCGNATCTAGNSVFVPDGEAYLSTGPSLVLDNDGNPAVSFDGFSSSIGPFLRVLRCGNPSCTTGNSTTTLPGRGEFSSLVLDAFDNPVIAYDNGLLNCGNPTCTAGNTTAGGIGALPSLALDSAGSPVVTYRGAGGLTVLHCGNPTCTAGKSIATPGGGVANRRTSLALDGAGSPVVAYYDADAETLGVLHCGNADCTAGNSITSPDTEGNVGEYPSLELDVAGNPVISYYDRTNGDLRVLHCGNPDCSGVKQAPTPKPTDTPPPPAPLDFSIAVDTDSNGTDDCTTKAGGPATCYLSPSTSFFVNLYLNGISPAPSYQGYDAYFTFTGVARTAFIDPTPWPECDFALIGPNEPDNVSFGCAAFLRQSTYVGLLARVEFACAASGSITMLHGPGKTVLARHTEYYEGDPASETLDINCSATDTPTPTPTSTPTPGPPVGGISRDPQID